MDKFTSLFHTLIVGGGLSVAFYWLGVLLGKLSANNYGLKWWLRLIMQGMILAAAMKVFKIFA